MTQKKKTILLYEDIYLEENSSKGFRLWKACHISSYILAIVCGIGNYYLLHSLMRIFDGQCVLYPRNLDFIDVTFNITKDATGIEVIKSNFEKPFVNDSSLTLNSSSSLDFNETDFTDTTQEISNGSFVKGQYTVAMLDVLASDFQRQNKCDLPIYTPILSVIFGMIWCTMFMMCPGGGWRRTGLRKPWRILAPALIFALAFFAFTAHHFVVTNNGLQELCAAFSKVTNTTACSAIDGHIMNVTVSTGSIVTAARSAAAGVWASWACAAALLIARCLTAPDFNTKYITVELRNASKEMQKKQNLTPKSTNAPRKQITRQNGLESPPDSPSSAPTLSTEVVSASMEPTPKLVGTSLNNVSNEEIGNSQLIELSGTERNGANLQSLKYREM